MTTRTSATLVLVLVALAPAALALPILPSPPENDSMNEPADLVLGTQTQSTVDATTELGEPLPCGMMGATVWFRLFATETATLSLATNGSSFDTVLAAYADVPSDDTLLGCNDDHNGTASYLEVPMVAGQTVLVQAGGFNGNAGDLALHAWTGAATTLPDLVILDVAVFDEAQSETFAVRALLHNDGGEAPSPFQVTFAIDGALVSTASYPAGMPAGYMLEVWAYPPRLDNRTHLLEVVADPEGTLTETNEYNNGYALELGVASSRNASIDIVSLQRVPLRTEAGDLRHPLATYEAVLTLCNWADGHDHVTVLLSLEGGGDGTRVNLGGTRGFDLYSAQLGPGECDTRRVRFDTATAVGDFTLVAVADLPGEATPEDNVDTARAYNLVGGEVGFVLPLV